MSIEQRDIILINFPFSDLTGAKVRPALVISNSHYHKNYLDAVVLALTSNLTLHPYKLLINTQDLEKGNLPAKSAIRTDKPFSILQRKVLKVQAKITVEKLDEVKIVLQQLIS